MVRSPMLLLLLEKLYEENLGYYQIKIPQKVLEIVWFDLFLTLFSLGVKEGGGNSPLTSFFPVSSTNVEISPQNFSTFSFNPFSPLV